MAVENKNKQADKMQAAGTSAVYKKDRLRAAIAEEMKKDGVKEAVMAYIFDGNPDSVSPLAEIRKENQ
jgi:hypothetical protein